MPRAFIVTPTFYLTGGGGVKVALYMAQVLLENGWIVHLVSLGGWGVDELDRSHGTCLRKYYREGKLVLNYLFGFRDAVPIPFPMAVKLIGLHIEKLVATCSSDLVIFHDDVPRINDKLFKYVSSCMLYSHFPCAARSFFNIVDAVEVGSEKLRGYKTRLYYNALRKGVYYEDIPREVMLVANSTVTRAFMEILWKRSTRILYPPVTLQPGPKDKFKEDSIVLVGGQPNKRVGDAIKALVELKKRNKPVPRLYVVAHYFEPWYKDWLINLVHELELQQYVHFIEHIPEDELINIYTSAKIILSTAHFEPFGMSIPEGMLFHDVPIVYRGALSGPWIDTVDKGRYGIGFRTLEELAEALCSIIALDKNQLGELQEKVFERAHNFSLEVFKARFTQLVEG
jgi:glycosyltransferase involved in cell wall biosynthesis